MLNALKNMGKYAKSQISLRANTRVLRDISVDIPAEKRNADNDYAELTQLARDIEDITRGLKRDESMMHIVKEAHRGVEYIRKEFNQTTSEMLAREATDKQLEQQTLSLSDKMKAAEARINNNMKVLQLLGRLRSEIRDVKTQLEEARDDVLRRLSKSPEPQMDTPAPRSVYTLNDLIHEQSPPSNVVSIHDKLLSHNVSHQEIDYDYTPKR